MESNFKELKMRLTKEAIVEEYGNAITTIESKDEEIGEYKNHITSLTEDIKTLRKSLKESHQSDYSQIKQERDDLKVELETYRKKDIDNVVKENQELKQSLKVFATERQEALISLGELIDMIDGVFKSMSAVLNTGFNSYDILKRRYERKWAPPKEEGK